MSDYTGKPGGEVLAGDEPLPLRLDLMNHSPTGFAWGYGGSGPAQLALALLAHALGPEREREALPIYQDYKRLVIEKLPSDQPWSLTKNKVLAAAVVCGLQWDDEPLHFMWLNGGGCEAQVRMPDGTVEWVKES